MHKMTAINPEQAPTEAKALLDRIQRTKGMVNNQMKAMANAPAALQAFVNFDEALASGVLSDQERERIALTVAEISGCHYSLAVHCALGRLAGLSGEEIQDSRRGVSPDRRLEAIMQFARQMVVNQGRVRDADQVRLARLGCGHEEIAEILANVVLAQFSSYFNYIAGTARDFPKAPDLTTPRPDTGSPGSHAKETTT